MGIRTDLEALQAMLEHRPALVLHAYRESDNQWEGGNASAVRVTDYH